MIEDDKNFGSWRSLIGRFLGTIAGIMVFGVALTVAIARWGITTGISFGAILAIALGATAYGLVYAAWNLAVESGLAARVASRVFR